MHPRSLTAVNSPLELEETLDELNPLRHFSEDEEPSLQDVLPAQPPSVHNQLAQLVFPSSQDGISRDLTVKLAVDASPGCGGVAWPAGEVLSKYIARNGSLKGRNVLELGSGTGLVGLVAGMLGANVWITDQAPLLETMRNNVIMNGLSERVSPLELNWGDVLPQSLPPSLDLILAADCVYFEPAFPLLVQTLIDLVNGASPEPDILFCYKKRRKADKRFFALLKKAFSWTEVTDDPDRDIYSREAISLFHLVARWKGDQHITVL